MKLERNKERQKDVSTDVQLVGRLVLLTSDL